MHSYCCWCYLLMFIQKICVTLYKHWIIVLKHVHCYMRFLIIMCIWKYRESGNDGPFRTVHTTLRRRWWWWWWWWWWSSSSSPSITHTCLELEGPYLVDTLVVAAAGVADTVVCVVFTPAAGEAECAGTGEAVHLVMTRASVHTRVLHTVVDVHLTQFTF